MSDAQDEARILRRRLEELADEVSQLWPRSVSYPEAREGVCARVAAGGITARVGNTLGAGVVVAYDLDDDDEVTLSDGQTIAVKNDRVDWTGTEGDEIQIKPAYNGRIWLVDVAPCPEEG